MPNGPPPRVSPQVIVRAKELEQSHLCLGTTSYPQSHDDRYMSYILNTVLGGSMSLAPLPEHPREARPGLLGVQRVERLPRRGQHHDLRRVRQRGGRRGDRPVRRGAEDAEAHAGPGRRAAARAKDHLKGSLMLSLENTASRMSHLARQEIYFDRHFGLDETLAGVEAVSTDDIQRVAADLFSNGSLAATVVGPLAPELPPARLD